MRTMRVVLATCLLCAVVVVAPGVQAEPAAAATRTWWVDDDVGDNANPGTSELPLRTIEAAVAQAVSGDTIMVRPGTYGPDPEQDFPINLPPGVALRSTGGAEATIIEGNGVQRVISVVDATAGTTVSGFTITSGAGDGAGILISRTTPATLEHWPLVERCVLQGNGTPTSSGGALKIDGVAAGIAEPDIVDTVVTGNVATDGAIFSGNHANATFVGCAIENNDARGATITGVGPGGGATFVDCGIKWNQEGGLLFSCSSGDYELFDCDILYNKGVTGAGLYIHGCNPVITATRILGNDASGAGGGAYVSFSTTTFANCLISGNDGSVGGAAYSVSGSMAFLNSTVADNSSEAWAGIYASPGGSASLRNCVVWGHRGKDVSGASALDYTCTEDTDLAPDNNTVGVGVIHDDPRFHSIWTYSYRLETGSPCIDTGDPASYATKDFFGKTRPIDGDGDGTAKPDMGYYEYLASRTTLAAPTIVSYNGRAILSATLKNANGSLLTKRWVAFEYSLDGLNWTLFANALADGSGSATAISYPLLTRTYFRALFLGDETYPDSESAKVTVKPKAWVGNPVAPSKMSRSKYYTVYGYLKPHHTAGGSPVRIYRYRYVSGRWKSYSYVTAKVSDYSSYSKYSRSIKLPYAGRWRLRAYAPADTLHAAAWSSGYDYVTVY